MNLGTESNNSPREAYKSSLLFAIDFQTISTVDDNNNDDDDDDDDDYYY